MGKFLRVPDTFCWVNQQMTWLVGPTAWSACTTWSDQLLLAPERRDQLLFAFCRTGLHKLWYVLIS